MKNCEVVVPRNTIIVNNEGVPKVYYLIKLSYYPFQVPQGQDNHVSPVEKKNLYVLKNFGDFKYLNEFVKASDLQLANGISLPVFPQKRNATGQKKLGNELQQQLEMWMRDLLRIPVVVRMLCVRNFFVVSVVSEETFEQMV